MATSRQLAAIMFTDIVGYTALMGKDKSQIYKDQKSIKSQSNKYIVLKAFVAFQELKFYQNTAYNTTRIIITAVALILNVGLVLNNSFVSGMPFSLSTPFPSR